MTSYGDPNAGAEYGDDYQRPPYTPPSASSGRASVPSDGYGYEYSDDEPDVQGGGSPSVPAPAGPGGHPAGGYSSGYGDDRVSQDASAPVSPPSPPNATGRASVPSPSAGRATVGAVAGRASVPTTIAGQAGVRPGGPPGFPEPGGPVAGGAGHGPGSGPKNARRSNRWRNIVLASVAVLILLAGGGMIGGTYFYDNVPKPEQLKLKENTEIFSVDGKQIARLGSENRVLVPMATLEDEIQKALIAGEDKNFYDHNGIDMWGIARAAWNNLTGGETQGASTITQQYARAAADDLDVTYARKLREAVMARKLEETYDKGEILGFYVNTVYYGRSANGVGAAARAYFGKEADKLSVEEAAVLGAVLKQPEPSSCCKGYDPANDLQEAKRRWGYVLDNMVDMRWLDKTRRDAMVYPKTKTYKPGQNSGETGYQNSGTGNVINYVAEEMRAWGKTNWRTAGYKITTTIDKRAQNALEKHIRRDIKGSSMYKQPKNLMSAAVAINPTNGRVIAYYGGMSGAGIDYAGRNNVGSEIESGGHPPASSFKIYTLAAAIESGISIDSHWDSSPLLKKKGAEFDVHNANRENDASCSKYCTLERMAILSYNVPFYKITKQIGPEKVVDMARRAGITTMWSTRDGKAIHVNEPNAEIGRENFYYQVGFGQYPVTVLDHASGVSTFAAHGVYNKPHFVVKVEKKNQQNGKWELVPGTGEVVKGKQAMTPAVADEVTSVMSKIANQRALYSGRESAKKTGTWESVKTKGENSNAWFVGFTPQIATAVWVGNLKNDSDPIRDKYGIKVGGSTLPGEIWEAFMNDAHQALKYEKMLLARGTGGDIGSREAGDGRSPSPSPSPLPPPPPPGDPNICILPLICPTSPTANGANGPTATRSLPG